MRSALSKASQTDDLAVGVKIDFEELLSMVLILETVPFENLFLSFTCGSQCHNAANDICSVFERSCFDNSELKVFNILIVV